MSNLPDKISEEDIRTALKEIKTYVDITEEDLKKIYEIALRHAKERLIAEIPVRKVMTKKVVTVKRDVSIHEAARLLSENEISGMPVVDEENRVIGIVTEADILSAVVKRKHTFKDVLRYILGGPLPIRKTGDKVREVMTSPVITATPDTDIKEVARVLDKMGVKRLPLVDDKGRLVGIISKADIVRVMGRK